MDCLKSNTKILFYALNGKKVSLGICTQQESREKDRVISLF